MANEQHLVVPKEWYTTKEAAQYLGVSTRTIYKWCKEGRLRTYILGERRTRRFRKVDLDKVPRLLEEPGQNGGEASEMAGRSIHHRTGTVAFDSVDSCEL